VIYSDGFGKKEEVRNGLGADRKSMFVFSVPYSNVLAWLD